MTSRSCVIRTGPDACVEGLPDPRQDKPRGPSAQKHYYKNSENRMAEQFVAQRTPDHLQKLYYKHSERKGPFTSRQERDHQNLLQIRTA